MSKENSSQVNKFDSSHILVCGNKTYEQLDLSNVVKRFSNIYRCNLAALPEEVDAVYGNLILCNHMFEALVVNRLEKHKFIEFYKHAINKEHLGKFFNSYTKNKEKFSSIRYMEPNKALYNRMLSSYNCPVKFVSRPRTGLTVIFECLKNFPNHKINVAGFSIKHERRRSFYVKKDYDETACHDPTSEINILRFLHLQGIVDASFCLLEDKKGQLSFSNDELIPTKFTLEMVKE